MLINGEEHNDLCIGIDLGTTNSVLSVINVKLNGSVISKVVDILRAIDKFNLISGGVKFETKKMSTLPSCVYYDEEHNYKAMVGDFAKNIYPLKPHLVAKSIKSQMGKEFAEGLSANVPDKTPSEIAAHILEHLLRNAEKTYRTTITDAVITVPANFDSIMCRATQDAAKIAGIRVTNKDGSERPVLLSEPNAVIYDFINQIHNGEIPSNVIDLSTKKNVMVFDLGGGTLDITLHEISRRENAPDILKVKEIATNRYTLLGGDDFDEAIAEAMFERYIKKYEKHKDILTILKREQNTIMPQLRVYAEGLKLDLSERHNNIAVSTDTDSWGDDDEENDFSVGGHIRSTGYAYDDTFTEEEIENILNPFMGLNLKFNDYKRINEIQNDTRNIIYPILDVLDKAAKKLQIDNVVIDSVIMNGGMSKFYMISERLKTFFGLDPIIALDPDLAVARGAAVYHYYLHKYEEMMDDMRMVGDVESKVKSIDNSTQVTTSIIDKALNSDKKTVPHPPLIEWGHNILNDSLYLATKNDTRVELIPSGTELPFTSAVKTGFQILPNSNQIIIPILSRNIDNSFRTIAKGNINFAKKYPEGAYVAFKVYMRSNKVITMEAWTCNDKEGKQVIEEGRADIAIFTDISSNKKGKLVPQIGSKLNPKAELNNIEQCCKNYEKYTGKNTINKRSAIATEIKVLVSNVCSAGNKLDFADPIINSLESTRSEEFKQRCLIISRKIGAGWNDNQKKRLARICMNQLDSELQGIDLTGYARGSSNTNTKIQSIYTMSMCASKNQLNQLQSLHGYSRYLEACLYTHAKTKTQIDWIYESFKNDIDNVKKGFKNNIQFSSYSIGLAFYLDGRESYSTVKKDTVVAQICSAISSKNISVDEVICCILALGWICDHRQNNDISQSAVNNALETINMLNEIYSDIDMQRLNKVQNVSKKIIQGLDLDNDEEKFLLLKLEK